MKKAVQNGVPRESPRGSTPTCVQRTTHLKMLIPLLLLIAFTTASPMINCSCTGHYDGGAVFQARWKVPLISFDSYVIRRFPSTNGNIPITLACTIFPGTTLANGVRIHFLAMTAISMSISLFIHLVL